MPSFGSLRAATKADSSTTNPLPHEMNTASLFIALNSGAPMKSRVSRVPGRVQTTKSERSKSSSFRDIGMHSSASGCGCSDLLNAKIFMPKARARLAPSSAMLPNPTNPIVLPCKTGMVNLSQFFCCLFSRHLVTFLLKCKAAIRIYSPSDSLKAPLPLVRITSGLGTSLSKVNSCWQSTPVEKQWNHLTDGHTSYISKSADSGAPMATKIMHST
mmetsp:Transcript_17129/g.37737  ORF Transcript_17129/g.37737 Transcript_17129/m.37737 type:complete len:215 (+) Transcript_17129:382-1026(+)